MKADAPFLFPGISDFYSSIERKHAFEVGTAAEELNLRRELSDAILTNLELRYESKSDPNQLKDIERDHAGY